MNSSRTVALNRHILQAASSGYELYCTTTQHRIRKLSQQVLRLQFDNIKFGAQDRMHQPQRGSKMCKYLYLTIESTRNVGAVCAY